MEVFLGIPAADGTGIGTAFVIPDPVKRAIPQHHINIDQINRGWSRFEAAVQTVTLSLSEHLDSLSKTSERDRAQREVFETYILMLEDPVFKQEVRDFYENQLFNIEYTVQFKAEEYAAKLRQAGNYYLSERAQDITDVFGRVLDEMLDIHPFDINSVPDGSVILATSLSSADTIILSKRKIAGLALSEGGVSSHVVILARNYGIPTVVGLEEISKKVRNGETVIIDGKDAEILVSPDRNTIEEYKAKIREEYQRKLSLRSFLSKPAVTKDGTRFKLYANIGTPEEAEIALAEGADGIGLFRTEFLYMAQSGASLNAAARSFSEQTQFEAYKSVLQIMGDKPVTIRTLDAGGDKLINSVDLPAIEEKNPLMGLRAVRLSLEYPNILKTQLRALYRASVYGNLEIMFPLITSVDQVKECLELVNVVKQELTSEKIPFQEDTPVGIMIETAAAALISDCLSKVSDFFSLGTNDLTQYTLGIDRENQHVSGLYNEFSLAVLRLIEMTVRSAKENNIPLAVCGEMAGRQDSVMVLAGMGIRNLSMSPKLISSTKELLSRFTIAELEAISAKHLNNL
ncbi:phosphotransferase system, enzyme I, PtsI [Treponema bryantii]|uniref:Phosphoenolpyruvate-protein phosphotransferase n=1 Tax=Treponema bryantii TaxID=163 RepID=A0A1H9CTA1_9SPIR|nr:phosphoenolpyruvate--protein phosphotransferase [Treponema bryantii]BDC92276.1 phosphoenolpyruvate-protein phosphotransferase [Treponema bryantii]SEQ04404.1 phosphotransferase system, enzyme I, PtsI [Treponema bryantii]